MLDHACPFTIRASTKPRVHRVPNVVGVGLAKCGTGTLAFLGETNWSEPEIVGGYDECDAALCYCIICIV